MPRGMKKSETLVQMEAAIKKYTSEVHLTEDDIYDVDRKQPPRFVTQIQSQTELTEMQSTKFECQLAPVGDPNMKVEWFFNGKPLSHSKTIIQIVTTPTNTVPNLSLSLSLPRKPPPTNLRLWLRCDELPVGVP